MRSGGGCATVVASSRSSSCCGAGFGFGGNAGDGFGTAATVALWEPTDVVAPGGVNGPCADPGGGGAPIATVRSANALPGRDAGGGGGPPGKRALLVCGGGFAPKFAG